MTLEAIFLVQINTHNITKGCEIFEEVYTRHKHFLHLPVS